MASMTNCGISAILDGISRKLAGTFPGVPVSGDSQTGVGLEHPAFFVAVLKPSRLPGLGPWYRAVNPFDVQYFPAEEGSSAELLAVGEQLMDTLGSITVQGNPVRGTKLSYEMTDGMLHFFVHYNITGRRAIPDDPAMGTADVVTEIKE